jgi:HSP20 family protein
MLRRTDPFRELDRLAQQVLSNTPGTWSRPTAMPMDAYRVGDEFVVAFDGVAPAAIELDVERNVLTVKAERRPVSTGEQVEMQVAERPLGCSPGNCSSATPSTPRTSTPPTTPES